MDTVVIVFQMAATLLLVYGGALCFDQVFSSADEVEAAAHFLRQQGI